MDPNDKIFAELTEKQLQILRVDAKMRKEVLKELKKLEKQLVARIANAKGFTKRRLARLLKDVKDSINKTYKVINLKMNENIRELSRIEQAGMVKTLERATAGIELGNVPIAKVIKLVSEGLIQGAPSETWWSRQASALIRSFEDNMRMGILLGETNSQLVRRVRGSRAFGFNDGIMRKSTREAEALVRTSVQSAANQARFSVMEDNLNIIGSYRHVSALDSKTTIRCIVRDSKRWDAKTKKPIKHKLPFQVPPIHWGCRSNLVAEIKGVTLPDSAIRAAEGGAISANDSFEDFLNKKGKAFADEVLGPGRAELWRDGKITLSQLLDQSGNPLTLKQLESKYN